MAGRRTSLASLAGQKVDNVPGQSDPLLLTLPLDRLVPTRFNPRRNFGTPEDLQAFGLILKHRQLQPAVVVSRAAYLKLWPDEAESVGTKPYVIANGERRYRASLAAGLPTLNVVHNEGVASSRADFLDAVLSENNDREDLDPIERALGIETMVVELGGADAVAAHYSKSKGWVSQQRKLLKLTDELQALVSAGELPIRIGRDIAGLPADQQGAAWSAEMNRREESKAAPRSRAVRQDPPTRDTVASPAPVPAPETVSAPPRFTAVNQNREQGGEQVVSEPPGKHSQVAQDTPLPEPRRTPPATLQPTGEQEAVPPAQAWQLPPGGWEGVFDAVSEQMAQHDRHMLTLALSEAMERDLGGAAVTREATTPA